MTLSEELTWRGLIKDKTFESIEWLDKPKTFYLGIDVGSADSLTVGNLAVFLLAKRMHKAGWNTVLLVGGATSLIGDPGGKNSERELVSREQVEHNKLGIQKQLKRLFENQKFSLVDNYDWFKDVGYLEFLRDIGKHYSMTELIQREYIAERMGEQGGGISYAEFSYSLIQGYDYWQLFKNMNVELQIGGSDQWGNMLSGVPLIRKKEGHEVHAMSMPLVINKATGQKFGKSEAGAIWLDSTKTSPSDFYQFWINVDDASVGEYLKIFTELDRAQIAKIMTEFEANKPSRLAQKTLAHEVTKLVHGLKAADNAATHAGALGQSSQILSGQVAVGDNVVEVLVKYGLASSKTEARQIMESGGIYINNQQSMKTEFEASDFHEGRVMVRRGKALKNTIVLGQK